MQRLEDWKQRLNAFIESRRTTPFEWGFNDCCLFAAQAIEAQTGVNVALRYLDAYRTRKEAKDVLLSITECKTYREAIEALPAAMGFTEVDPRLAQRGDLVLIRHRSGSPSIGVVSLDGRYAVAPGFNRMMRVPALESIKAWKI